MKLQNKKNKIIETLKDWWLVILTVIGVISLIQLFRNSGDIDDSVLDISEEIKKKEDLLNQLKEVEKLNPSDEELLKWLNKE